MFCGGGILALGAAMIRFYGMEGGGIVVASIGVVVAAAGCVIGVQAAAERGSRTSSAYRLLLRFFAALFLAVTLWSLIDGVLNIFHCARSFASGASAKAMQICIFVGVEFATAAACALLSATMLRHSKRPTSPPKSGDSSPERSTPAI